MSSSVQSLNLDADNDTIAAIATAPGKGAVGIVRVSGPLVCSIIEQLAPDLETLTPRYVHFLNIIDPQSKKQLDEAILLYFKGPQSLTGEDVVEFQCHGGDQVLKSVLGAVLHCGARLAGPGEFTKRAFVNGKMDLSKAESIIDIIEAKSSVSHAVAMGRVQGRLANSLTDIRATFIHILEQVEASIDFPDEVGSIDRDDVRSTLADAKTTIEKILKWQDFGRYVRSGVKVLIVGKPNAGKSSLLNALLGAERAIVTDIPGTTRDFIDAELELGGVLFKFMDTAGLRSETTDVVEAMGMAKISELLNDADVILFLVDGSEDYDADNRAVWDRISSAQRIYTVLTKSDKAARLSMSDLPSRDDMPVVTVSTHEQSGLDELKMQLMDDYVTRLDGIDLDLLCNVRQNAALADVLASLDSLLTSLSESSPDDLLSIDLKAAIVKLGEVTGDDVTEEVLDGIFHRFCIGK